MVHAPCARRRPAILLRWSGDVTTQGHPLRRAAPSRKQDHGGAIQGVCRTRHDNDDFGASAILKLVPNDNPIQLAGPCASVWEAPDGLVCDGTSGGVSTAHTASATKSRIASRP